jgi:hypothetical protein
LPLPPDGAIDEGGYNEHQPSPGCHCHVPRPFRGKAVDSLEQVRIPAMNPGHLHTVLYLSKEREPVLQVPHLPATPVPFPTPLADRGFRDTLNTTRFSLAQGIELKSLSERAARASQGPEPSGSTSFVEWLCFTFVYLSGAGTQVQSRYGKRAYPKIWPVKNLSAANISVEKRLK